MKSDFIETFDNSEALFERIAELKQREGKLSYSYEYDFYRRIITLKYSAEFTQEVVNDEP